MAPTRLIARSLIVVATAVAAAGCQPVLPAAVSIGEKKAPGYYLASGDEPGLMSTYYGYLVGSDAPGHYSIAWVDNIGADDVFNGTIQTDGTFDPNASFAHTGQENLTFDSPSQVSFHSMPGRSLHGIDVVTSSDVIYLDAQINHSHVGVNIDFLTLATNCGTALWNTVVNPVAFTRDLRAQGQTFRCAVQSP